MSAREIEAPELILRLSAVEEDTASVVNPGQPCAGGERTAEESTSPAKAKPELGPQDLEALIVERTAHLRQTMGELEEAAGIFYGLLLDIHRPLRVQRNYLEVVLREAEQKLGPDEQLKLRKAISQLGLFDRSIERAFI